MRYYYITDSKADIENFKQKFSTDDKGRDIYSLFIKYKDRLKNHGISNDITYHTKHTSKEEMLDILYRMDNQSYENEKGEISKNNYKKIYENNSWLIVEPLDWQTSMALGDGTTWCITGRYNTNGEVKPSQAEKYFNEYLRSYYQTYYFVYDKKNGEKYCICPKTRGDVDIWNEENNLINSGKLLRPIGEEGVESMNLYIDFPDENGFLIENGVLKEYEGNKKEIVIPNGVEEIGDSAFDGCRSLQFVTIPGSVKKIGEYAFYNCYSLQSIIISNGVEGIGDSAFDGCRSLQFVTIPGSVKKIGEYAFYNCYSLQSIIISNGVKEIGNFAFAYCNSLQSITIPGSIKEIGENAFHGCDSLKSIYINDEKTAHVVLENNPELENKIVLR